MGHAGEVRESIAGAHARDLPIAVAVLMIRASGVAAVTMPVVAERCGVSVRTLYRHFGSRDELVGAALYVILDDIRPSDPVPVESLAEATRELADRVAAQPHVFALVADGAIDGGLADVFGRAHYEKLRQIDEEIAPVLAFLSSPHAPARIAVTCGCTRTEAVAAIVHALQRILDEGKA